MHVARRSGSIASVMLMASLGVAIVLQSALGPEGVGAARARGVNATAQPEAQSTPVEARLSSDSIGELACGRIDAEALTRVYRGIRGNRSGDILLIPDGANFVNGGLTHATPFDYTQDVPLLLYGPGYVRPGAYREEVTLADVAPTAAALLGFPFEAPDGRPLTEALLPEAERPRPALIVTVVWDSVGDNVLERWPDAWPVLDSLREGGAWFEDASVGASPSNTPVAHATIGTGAFPSEHGLVDVYIRVNGELVEPVENGPETLRLPTLADLYDVAMGNEPKVGTIGTLADHLMMMSHGAAWEGGDADLAITREVEKGPTTGIESTEWNLAETMALYYAFPRYANDTAPLEDYLVDVDRADGAIDGKWRDNDIAMLGGGFDTPARAPYQQELIEAFIEREAFGADDVPDLLYLNYKTADKIGHLFSADGIEMSDTVAAQDEVLDRLVEYLDSQVGEGRWVMFLVADHGTQRDPETSGAFMIDADKLRAELSAAFDDGDDVPVVQKLRPSQVWLDQAELRESGFTLLDVANFLMELTQADTFMPASPPVPGEEDEPVFAAVLPSGSVGELPCLPPEELATDG